MFVSGGRSRSVLRRLALCAACAWQEEDEEAKERRGRMAKNPLTFIDEVRQEVRKVTWPTWKEVWITTVMVLIMVALSSLFFLFADQIIGWIVQLVLGIGR